MISPDVKDLLPDEIRTPDNNNHRLLPQWPKNPYDTIASASQTMSGWIFRLLLKLFLTTKAIQSAAWLYCETCKPI